MDDAARSSPIVRVPSPIWLLGLIILGLALDRVLGLAPVVQHRVAGAVLVVGGLLLSGWARAQFARQQAEIRPHAESHSVLVTSGPFRFSRNPMYLGLIAVGIGVALLAGTWLMWLVPVVVFALDNFVIVPFEERSMARTFGGAYTAYQSQVRRWL